ncbi:phage head-tail connector protein [Halalkalibacter sp. APA_J-10(15)]|uniref:phage head-tail connector protein n=1 Tax=Halalkalibacter sp. APA_J-10(15) TaxID=2933805 RepID=UPI001FF365FD|nr:phage head-tail connector protein [Halalkalibacter sp. APA_J-10(15)]MCK0470888.1 phage head-tail connector protein [Halalkalibacter sp. APA_J-10(15)]
MSEIQNLQLLLDLKEATDEEIQLLYLYIESAQDFIYDYCNVTEIPPTLRTVVNEMVVFLYRSRGVENVYSESEGSLSENYITEYPQNIMNRLNRHRKIRVI